MENLELFSALLLSVTVFVRCYYFYGTTKTGKLNYGFTKKWTRGIMRRKFSSTFHGNSLNVSLIIRMFMWHVSSRHNICKTLKMSHFKFSFCQKDVCMYNVKYSLTFQNTSPNMLKIVPADSNENIRWMRHNKWFSNTVLFF